MRATLRDPFSGAHVAAASEFVAADRSVAIGVEPVECSIRAAHRVLAADLAAAVHPRSTLPAALDQFFGGEDTVAVGVAPGELRLDARLDIAASDDLARAHRRGDRLREERGGDGGKQAGDDQVTHIYSSFDIQD
jgi:hypothetical protein